MCLSLIVHGDGLFLFKDQIKLFIFFFERRIIYQLMVMCKSHAAINIIYPVKIQIVYYVLATIRSIYMFYSYLLRTNSDLIKVYPFFILSIFPKTQYTYRGSYINISTLLFRVRASQQLV